MTADVILAALLIAYLARLWADDRAAGRKHAKEMAALAAKTGAQQ